MGRDPLRHEPDWTLPGMEKFSDDDIAFFKRDLAASDGSIVNSIHSIGWALWPTTNKGYFDENLLRKIADFIEIQNKPFWDEYDEYCRNRPQDDLEPVEFEEIGI